jgi:hypothetical protein
MMSPGIGLGMIHVHRDVSGGADARRRELAMMARVPAMPSSGKRTSPLTTTCGGDEGDGPW